MVYLFYLWVWCSFDTLFVSYFTLTALLVHTGLQQQGIFRVPGSQVEVNDIKNAFERG